MSDKLQFWIGSTFMGLVTKEEADEIEENARKNGWKVIRQPAMISIEKD